MTWQDDATTFLGRAAEIGQDESKTWRQKIQQLQTEFGVDAYVAEQAIELVTGRWTSDEVVLDDQGNRVFPE